MLGRVLVSASAPLALSGVLAIYAELALDEYQRRPRAAARCRASTEDPAVARADGACTYTPLSPSTGGRIFGVSYAVCVPSVPDGVRRGLAAVHDGGSMIAGPLRREKGRT